MATRTPQRGHGGEAADTKRKERRHGKSELSPKLKGVLKGGAAELAMATIPPFRVGKIAGAAGKRIEGFLDEIDVGDIPELWRKVWKMRGPKNAMTTTPRGGDMTAEILENNIMLVADPKTGMQTRFRGKVQAGGKRLEWAPEGVSRFNRQAIREINDKYGVNLIRPADLKAVMRKAAEAKAKNR